jgi:hypothetical protein
VDRKRVDLFDVGAAVNAIGPGLDDDVDLMRHAPHAKYIFSAHCMIRVASPPWRPVIVFSPSDDVMVILARQCWYSASRNLTSMLNMFMAVDSVGLGDIRGCDECKELLESEQWLAL